MNGKKVIVHNLTLRGIENVPGVLDFDQRGILFAKPNDIVLTKRNPEESFLKYLESLGWNFKGVKFISPKSLDGYKYNSIFYDPDSLKEIKKATPSYIDCYQVTTEEDKFSKRVQLPLFANTKICLKYGTKSGFRKLCKELKFNVASGFEDVKSPTEALKGVLELFNSGANAVVVKIDEGLSGVGNTKIKRDFLVKSKNEQLEILKNSLTKVPQAKTSGSVIEQWVNDVVASPSIQIKVWPNKKIEILSMHDQLLEGEEQWYIGCIYPPQSISNKFLEKIRKEALTYTKYIVNNGYFGYFGLDTIIDKRGKIWWTEANMRKPGTFYPAMIAKKLNNGTLKNIYYVACDFTVPVFKGQRFRKVKDQFKMWLYPIKGEKRGMILYNTGAIKDAGRFDVVCLGRSNDDAFKIYSEVKTKVDEFKRKKYDERS